MPAKYLSRTACVVFPLLLAACAAQPQPAPVEKPQRVALADLSCDQLGAELEVADARRNAKARRSIAWRMKLGTRLNAVHSNSRKLYHTITPPDSIWTTTEGGRAPMDRMLGIQREMAKRC